MVDIGDILFCNSKNSFTKIFLRNQKNNRISRNNKELEEELSLFGFFRYHQSFQMNLLHIIRIEKKMNIGSIIMGILPFLQTHTEGVSYFMFSQIIST